MSSWEANFTIGQNSEYVCFKCVDGNSGTVNINLGDEVTLKILGGITESFLGYETLEFFVSRPGKLILDNVNPDFLCLIYENKIIAKFKQENILDVESNGYVTGKGNPIISLSVPFLM